MSHITDELMEFGLTKHEATIYITLLQQGAMTGYEVAKYTGISKSNTYISLACLADKGAAYVMEESVTKYTAVPFTEFSNNIIRKMRKLQDSIQASLPSGKQDSFGYITIRGRENIMNKVITMILESRLRIYLSVPHTLLAQLEDYLLQKLEEGIKIVLLTDRPYNLPGATAYVTPNGDNQVRLIVDSCRVFTGHITDTEDPACLYSQNPNLVEVFKAMLQNEITLIRNHLIQIQNSDQDPYVGS